MIYNESNKTIFFTLFLHSSTQLHWVKLCQTVLECRWQQPSPSNFSSFFLALRCDGLCRQFRLKHFITQDGVSCWTLPHSRLPNQNNPPLIRTCQTKVKLVSEQFCSWCLFGNICRTIKLLYREQFPKDLFYLVSYLLLNSNSHHPSHRLISPLIRYRTGAAVQLKQAPTSPLPPTSPFPLRPA